MKAKGDVTINVRGIAGVANSAIAKELAILLAGMGFEVELRDGEEGPNGFTRNTYTGDEDSALHEEIVGFLAAETKVKITTTCIIDSGEETLFSTKEREPCD